MDWITGYTCYIEVCPFCGEVDLILHNDGTYTCEACKKRFAVVEHDESESEL